MKYLFIILIFISSQSFAQKDSVFVSVGDQKGVSRYDIEYSMDGQRWRLFDSVKVVLSYTTYRIGLTIQPGFYRIHVLGVNQYTDTKQVFSPLAVDKYKLKIIKRGRVYE